MFKKMTISAATVLLATTAIPSVFAEESTVTNEDIDEVIDENVEDPESEENDEVIDEDELIFDLTIEDAINYGMNSSYSLLNLEYNIENIKSQLAGAEDKHRELKFDIRDLEREMDNLRKYGSATFEARYQIQEALKDMRDGLEDLEDAIEGLKTSEIVTEYTNQQTEELIPFQITSSFLQIIMNEEQIELQKENLEVEKQKVANMKEQYKAGTVSRTDYERAAREVTRLNAQIKEAEEKLQKELSVFALDIGIIYHDDLTLKAPSFGEVNLVTQKIETKQLIEDSYAMKIAEEKLTLERYNREQVYEDDDANKFDREQADIAVELALVELAETKRDAERTITELYTDISSQYYSIEDAERELQYAKADISDLKKRYNIGVISKQDYELANMQLTQAEIGLKLETYHYYLLTKQADLLEAGVILTN